jgi:hypothetical protein
MAGGYSPTVDVAEKAQQSSDHFRAPTYLGPGHHVSGVQIG